MAQQHIGSISMACSGAARRVRDVIIHPAPGDFFGKSRPDYLAQQQALTCLEWILAGTEVEIPYHKLNNASVLLPVKGSWALYQLFEAIQLRKAYQLEKVPGVTADEVAEAFMDVGATDKRWIIFPKCDVSPAARRAVLKLPGVNVGIDWTIDLEEALEETPLGKQFAVLTSKDGHTARVALPLSFFVNRETGIWEIEP